MTNIQHLFAPMPLAIAGEPFTREHALVLQAYNRFHRELLVAGYKPTVAHVNEAVEWWNETVVGGAEEDDWEPGRWYRVRKPDGTLWMETSDHDEAQAEADRTGWPLERLYVNTRTEWRYEQPGPTP